ncbi:hypothetical protein N7523_002079 [Penicillium sp. IBT 18751x]|nr:hypothetical protein N7523_002079 [Penicillium sp. IBT 18751x]
MEGEQDTQQHYARQADLRRFFDNPACLVSRRESDYNSHFSQPFESPSVATSVATSVGSLGGSASPADLEDEDAHKQSPLHARKRTANDSDGARKRNRNLHPSSRESDTRRRATQETLPKAFSSTTAIGTGLIHDTIQYLQTVSALITTSDDFSREGLAALHLATQLLQHRYEEINATDATDREDVIHCTPAQVGQETRCTRCMAEQEDHL